MNRRNQNIVLLLLAVMCIASRIPQLVSDKLLLDGDECVVAVMAKHLLMGKHFPVFFYGQTYGFSLIECLFIVPFYAMLGITTVAVKLGMLSLWTVGVLFLYRTFTVLVKDNKWLPLVLALVFIWLPAWAVWSMKARGGYLTAFTLTSITLYLLFREKRSWGVFALLGVLTFFIYESQPLWVPGLVPFLAYFLLKDKKLQPSLAFVAPIVVLGIAFHLYKQGIVVFGTIPVHKPDSDLVPHILRIPTFLYYSLHGNYFFDEIQKPNFFCAFVAVVCCVLILLLPLVAVYNMVTRRKGMLLFNVSTFSILLTLAATIFSFNYQPRYLLPVTGYAMVSFLLHLRTIDFYRRLVYGGACVTIIAGIVSLITFYNFEFSPIRDKSLRKTMGYLTSKGVHYAFCSNNFFTWQVLFYSNEQVICRENQLPGRYPEYIREVDSAFDAGAKTAFIVAPQQSAYIELPPMENAEGCQVLIDPPRNKMLENFPRPVK